MGYAQRDEPVGFGVNQSPRLGFDFGVEQNRDDRLGARVDFIEIDLYGLIENRRFVGHRKSREFVNVRRIDSGFGNGGDSVINFLDRFGIDRFLNRLFERPFVDVSLGIGIARDEFFAVGVVIRLFDRGTRFVKPGGFVLCADFVFHPGCFIPGEPLGEDSVKEGRNVDIDFDLACLSVKERVVVHFEHIARICVDGVIDDVRNGHFDLLIGESFVFQFDNVAGKSGDDLVERRRVDLPGQRQKIDRHMHRVVIGFLDGFNRGLRRVFGRDGGYGVINLVLKSLIERAGFSRIVAGRLLRVITRHIAGHPDAVRFRLFGIILVNLFGGFLFGNFEGINVVTDVRFEQIRICHGIIRFVLRNKGIGISLQTRIRLTVRFFNFLGKHIVAVLPVVG